MTRGNAMSDGGMTEIIWHFAGYLRLFETAPSSHPIYDPFNYQSRSADYAAKLPRDVLPKSDFPEFASKSLKVSLPIAPVAPAQTQLAPVDGGGPEKIITPVIHNAPGPHIEFFANFNSAGANGGFADILPQGELPYSVSYEDGGNDKVVSSVQMNVMDDDDRLVESLVEDSGAGLSEMHAINIPDVLSGMLEKARAETPQDLVSQSHSPLHWKELVEEHDAGIREEGGGAVEEGTYVNGKSISGTPPKTPSRPELPEQGEAGVQVMETGSNKAVNSAIIADLNESTGTLIVLGDYYETNAIVQANLYSDNDQILPGSPYTTQADTGDNLALNIASLVAQEYAGRSGAGISSKGLDVNVTIAEGDLFDIKSLTQRNWISDNDEAIQTTSEAFSATYVGGNQQTNAARFIDIASYDVIIVLGDYHDFNMISQTNILIDDDILGATGGGSGVGDASLHGGRNHLTNNASIENHGVAGFKDLTSDLEDLINTIGNRGIPDLSDWSSLAGSASGRLDVLVVRGDYWDINVISQTNVIVDADVALQHLAGGGGSQWMTTGGNDAHNTAKIMDMGAIFDQYLGGKHYTDAVMIQAEYIDASATIVNHDTMSLISEAVAFTGLLDQSAEDDFLDNALGHVGHDDMMGAVLT
jgi:hypothetical protein